MTQNDQAAEATSLDAERQKAAAQVGMVFGHLNNFLISLAHKTEEGKMILTKPLDAAYHRLQEASYWAVQHVLSNGTPKTPAVPAAVPANDEAPAGAGE